MVSGDVLHTDGTSTDVKRRCRTQRSTRLSHLPTFARHDSSVRNCSRGFTEMERPFGATLQNTLALMLAICSPLRCMRSCSDSCSLANLFFWYKLLGLSAPFSSCCLRSAAMSVPAFRTTSCWRACPQRASTCWEGG